MGHLTMYTADILGNLTTKKKVKKHLENAQGVCPKVEDGQFWN